MSILVSVVDSMHGRPAEGVVVCLGGQVDGAWQEIIHGHTDEQGQFRDWYGELVLTRGMHRLQLDIDSYYATLGLAPYYPRVSIDFRVADPAERHHIPVQITPYAYVIQCVAIL
jgi:5-hydroxyisourate hydrolase